MLEAPNGSSGGLELLFSNQRKHTIALPRRDEAESPANVAYLIRFLVANLMEDCRMDMFLLNETVSVFHFRIVA